MAITGMKNRIMELGWDDVILFFGSSPRTSRKARSLKEIFSVNFSLDMTLVVEDPGSSLDEAVRRFPGNHSAFFYPSFPS
jgi:hypothetical protein